MILFGTPLRQLLLASLLIFLTAPMLSAAAPQDMDLESEMYLEEGDEYVEMMLEILEVVAFEIGIEEELLFDALAHGLSCAQVAIAHQSRPSDLIASLATYEESLILDMLLGEEISREEAMKWRDENWIDTTLFLHEEDPFGLGDLTWLLDASCDYFDMEMLELLAWMDEGSSIANVAEYMEVDLEEVSIFAEELLEAELEILVILGEVEEDDANEWFEWLSEDMSEMLHDDALLEHLAEEIWFEESMSFLAELLEMEEDELWQALEEENLEQIIEDAKIDLSDLLEEFGAEELEELFGYLYYDEEEDFDDDFSDENEDF
ncbi:MAG: hypothetical protein GY747_11940 [Planctomycetes bacterium]|nr:hypothetical protein [Planctomycetota bacterium]MCP4771704.1 hypothetical protein [Planctomycetota bacterium]MCP4859996.1 hypothetical protein [Planctomycetota bacterium]